MEVMRDLLISLAGDVLGRLVSAEEPQRGPQLLAAAEGHGLLRLAGGLEVVSADQLPTHVDLSPLIDHTLLKADGIDTGVDQLCAEARMHRFASVCVNGAWVARAAEHLAGSGVRVCTVVGFPLGASTSATKAFEAKDAAERGADEIDMVLAIGAAKGGDWELVRRDMEAVRAAVQDRVLKVILETCLLTDEEKVRACEIAAEVGCDFVKTSTGFSTGGATEADIALMRQTVGVRCGVKASGGVRDYAGALGMVLSGATRLGLSSSLAVVAGGAGTSTY